ncbi:hypothetical protein KKH39_04020 [Patescibacteria group bacterium]|nr:hypothetical protein [Patescibacteria group bacterium]
MSTDKIDKPLENFLSILIMVMLMGGITSIIHSIIWVLQDTIGKENRTHNGG